MFTWYRRWKRKKLKLSLDKINSILELAFRTHDKYQKKYYSKMLIPLTCQKIEIEHKLKQLE